MYTVDDFAPELALIKDKEILDFTIFCLEHAPAYFYTVASSSTGKYHSGWSNGEGGLVRHTRATALMAAEFARMFGLEGQEADATVAAALLHDLCKYGLPGGKYTTKDHCYTAAKFVHALHQQYKQAVPLLDKILGGIAWHNGRWTKRTNGQRVKSYPAEFSVIEQAVHAADYAASRSCISFPTLEPNLIG